jgi:hypothetical protein
LPVWRGGCPACFIAVPLQAAQWLRCCDCTSAGALAAVLPLLR